MPESRIADLAPPADPDRRLFQAHLGSFADAADRSTMDNLVRWVEEHFREDLSRRPSKHVYVRSLPDEVVENIDKLRDHPVIHGAIMARFPDGFDLIRMQCTDELYISHYNKDHGGDHGLYAKHYDGNLRFLPVGTVVRALIYLQSDGTYRVVFGDSGVARAFKSYDFAILDFHRELHWVDGEYNPGDRHRILLKCNYLLAPRHAPLTARMLLAANIGVFLLVKAAMEFSKSPRGVVQRTVGFACNAFRLLNNVHPLLPIGLVTALIGALGWALIKSIF